MKISKKDLRETKEIQFELNEKTGAIILKYPKSKDIHTINEIEN